MSALRVLHVIPAVAPRYGGPSRVVLSMCRALRTAGVDAEIASTDADGRARLPSPGETGTPVPTRLFSRQWSESFKYSRPLARWLDSHVREFDVVHVHAVFSHACLAAARACRRSGVPYVVRPLGSLDPWSLARHPVRKRLLWHAGVARMLRGAAAIHYTTDEERRLAEGPLGLGRGVVVPLGVDDELFEPPPAQEAFARRYAALAGRPYMLFLSRLHPKKGLELLLDALAGLSEGDRAGWRLVVAGDGEPAYVAELRRRAERPGQAGPVLFVGWLGGADRLAALRGAGLFVLPSQQENFGLAAAEAMAAGVPVIVSDRVNLAKEIREARAGWVVPLEPAALQAALAEALSGEAERRARGRAGRALASRRFTWASVAAQVEECYRSVIGTARSCRSTSPPPPAGSRGVPCAPVSVAVLTYNEERNLAACLGSVAGLAGEVFVVDSGSTDRTVEIARQHGANVVTHAFEGHAKQWNWALRELPFSFEWVLCLDADHRVTSELAEEIVALLGPRRALRDEPPGDVDGFYVSRRQIFRGKWIRHGTYYPKYLLKLVRRDRAWCDENELLDFRFYVKGGTAKLRHDLLEDNQNEQDISFWIAKHSRFAALQAQEEFRRRGHRLGWTIQPSLFGTPDQRTLWLKDRWYRMPLYVRPCLYFVYRYVLRLGFLDGKQGFVFHVLQGFWYRLLVDIHLDDLRRRDGDPGRADGPWGAPR